MNKTICLLFGIILFSTVCFAKIQFISAIKTIETSTAKETIKIEEKRIVPFSESVVAADSTLIRDKDYQIDYIQGEIKIISELEANYIQVSYLFYSPEDIPPLFNYQIHDLADSLAINSPKREIFDFWADNKKLTFSGSKTISVSIGNDNDFSLNQSMYLKLSGELSDNVFIDAQLNDSQSPITPEGNTRELSNLDEIYFKLYGKQYEIAFGDLEIEFYDTKFINYLNKFEGVKAKYFNNNELQAAIAVAKGKSADIELLGTNGKQGPYYLKPSNEYTNVKIIAGTEIIYLNSQLMQRGEDYYIDYDEGTISFQIKNIISSDSRIKATFQYSDENYRKNLYLLNNKTYITDRLSFSTHSIVSVDDKNNPLSFTLTDDNIDLLKESGDKPVYAAGDKLVDEGFGNYKKVHDGINEYYVYAPGDSLAVYDVSFTYVGENNGDYTLLGVHSYEYVGSGLGNYLPIVRLYAPEYKANWDLQLAYEHDIYQLKYEILLSDYDKNTYSNKDSSDDFSYIQDAELSFDLAELFLKPKISFGFREKKKNLITYAEIEEPYDFQFYYFHNPDSLASTSYTSKIKLNYYDKASNQLYIKLLNHNNYDEQIRLINEFRLSQQRFFPELNYNLIVGEQDLQSGEELASTNHSLMTAYQFQPFKLQLSKDLIENKDVRADTIFAAYKNMSDMIELKFNKLKYFSAGASYKQDKRYDWKGEYQQSYVADLYKTELMYAKSLNTNAVNYSHKTVDYLGNSENQKYDFVEARANNTFLNSLLQTYVNYSISNLEYYPKIRELQYVGSAQGFYDSLGVWSEDGEYDWVYAMAGKPVQTIDLKADLNGIISFNKLKLNNNFVKKFQLDSWYYVYESTKEPDKVQVYLLNHNYLMQDSTSIYSKILLRETLWYNHIPGKLIFKYVLNNEKGLDNRYQEPSKNTQKSHELQVLLNRYLEMDWELSFIAGKEYDSRYLLNTESKQSNINMKYVFSNNLIFNTKTTFSVDNNKNYLSSWSTVQKGISEDIMYFLGDRCRISSKIDFLQNTSSYTENLYLPEDKRKGTIVKWNNSVYYRFNTYTHLSFDYSGYDYPQRKTIHQVRMEVKAEF